MSTEQIHASCVALGDDGVLILGPSGSGKSDLALRLVAAGADLVADDRIDVRAAGDRLVAQPPAALAGLLEVRGLAIVEMPYRAEADIVAVIKLIPAADIARLPDPETETIAGLALPLFRIDATAASAVMKVRLAVDLARGRILRRDD